MHVKLRRRPRKTTTTTTGSNYEESDESEISGSDSEGEQLCTSEKDDAGPDAKKGSYDPHSNLPPTPASPSLKRLTLVLLLLLLFWAGFNKLRASLLEAKRNPKIVHANRYSKEFKYRPAASPIITETLKDGRIRLRGALQEPTASPPVPKQKTGKKRKQKASKKRKRSKV